MGGKIRYSINECNKTVEVNPTSHKCEPAVFALGVQGCQPLWFRCKVYDSLAHIIILCHTKIITMVKLYKYDILFTAEK